MTKPKDRLAQAIDEATPSGSANGGRILYLYGDRPEVLESIRRARKERKLTYGHIARLLTQNGDASVSGEAVKTFLTKEGIA